jgi:hypothetical protein
MPGVQTYIPSVAETGQQPSSEMAGHAQNQPPKEHVARVAALIASGKLSSAKAELDSLQRSYPASPQVRQLRRQWDSQNAGMVRESAGKKEETPKADLRQQEEEWNHRVAALLARGQYGESRRRRESMARGKSREPGCTGYWIQDFRDSAPPEYLCVRHG